MEGQYSTIFETNFPRTFRTILRAEQNDQPEDRTKKHVNHALRNSEIVAGVGVVIFAPAAILAMKGKLPKPISNFLLKTSKKLTKKIDELREKPHISKAENLYLHGLQKASNVANAVRGFVFNAGPLKDVLAEKALNKIGLKKVCGKITNFFENAAVTMTAMDYEYSKNTFALMGIRFQEVNKKLLQSPEKEKLVTINGVTKTVAEWAETAKTKLFGVKQDYKFFHNDAVQLRGEQLSQDFEGLGDKVFDKTYGSFRKFFTTPKHWTSFITEDIVAPDKARFRTKVMAEKRKITNSSDDVAKELKLALSDVASSLDMTNQESANSYKKLKKLVDGYDRTKALTNPEYKQEILDKIQNDRIREIITNDKNGGVEEILDIYKAILPESEFETVKQAAKKSKSALNTAVNTETDKYVDKIRDLKSGSAITDVGSSFLFPVVTTGVGMAMADTKEKKRSVLIKLGIPLLVGVGTSIAGTLAMLTAGPSLLLGIATTAVTNRICSYIDKKLRNK